ncbi:hypothetical protein BIU87_31790 [Streptomyces sp. ZS0098]|nr:hypothetical protein BIU87_31790 [Streptomyces sp. ZS0098]
MAQVVQPDRRQTGSGDQTLEEVGDLAGVEKGTVLLGEEAAGVLPAVAPRPPFLLLAGLVPEQELMRLVVEGDQADAAVGLGSTFVDLPAVLDELGGDGQGLRTRAAGDGGRLRDQGGGLTSAEETALAPMLAGPPAGGRLSHRGGFARPSQGFWAVLVEEGLPDPFLQLADAGAARVHRRLGAGDSGGANPQDARPPLPAVEPAESVDPFVAVVGGRRCGQSSAGELGDPGDHPVL